MPFPFDDLTAVKVRPAVCLTEPLGAHRHVVLAFISSQTFVDVLNSDVVLDAGQPDFVRTGLRVSSTLRLHRLMTAAVGFIHRELGELSPRMRAEVSVKLRELFDLA